MSELPTLDPKTYVSPSGEYALAVDPSDRLGRGGASYRLTRSGSELWSAVLPYTLWEAAVADDGTTAGYAYRAGAPGGDEDSLSIVVLDSHGATILHDELPREGFVSCMGGPEPSALGLILDPADGRWLGMRRLELGTVSQEWDVELATGNRVVLGYQELFLVAPDDTVLRTITRAPGGNWLRNMDQLVVAEDGSLAVSLEQENRPGVHLFTSAGEPLRTLPLPPRSSAWYQFDYDGKRLAVGIDGRNDSAGSIVVLDVEGRELFRFTPERSVSRWRPFFAAQSRELWLHDGERTIERYAIP